MAKLSKKEIRLLAIFLSVLAFAGNVIALKFYISGVRLARTQIATLTEQRQQIDALLADRAYWEERQQWMKEHQPSIRDMGEAQGELIERLQRTARNRGLTILEQRMPDQNRKQQPPRISAMLKVSAPMADVVGWLAEVQSPEAFLIVEQLTLSLDLKSNEEELPVVCTLQVGLLYQPEGGMMGPPGSFNGGDRGNGMRHHRGGGGGGFRR